MFTLLKMGDHLHWTLLGLNVHLVNGDFLFPSPTETSGPPWLLRPDLSASWISYFLYLSFIIFKMEIRPEAISELF